MIADADLDRLRACVARPDGPVLSVYLDVEHLRRVVELLDDVARANHLKRIVLAGPLEATSELARLLPRALAARVLGTLRLPVDASADEVLDETLALAEYAGRKAEKARVTDLLDRGRAGLDATLAAFQEGRCSVSED